MRARLAIVLLGLVLMATGPVRAELLDEYRFTVLRDGDPIGFHVVRVSLVGPRIEVAVRTELAVSIAFIPIYHFDHERLEIWQDGRPVSINSQTDNNGDELTISVQGDNNGFVRVINERSERFDDPAQILTFWNRDILDDDSFVSVVEDKTFDASFTLAGSEVISAGGRRIEAEHYRLTGDINRDIWYDEKDRVVRVLFERGGSMIDYVLDPPATTASAN